MSNLSDTLSFQTTNSCSQRWSTTALATTLAAFVGLWPTEGQAGCEVSDLQASCSGADIENIDSTGATYTDVTYSQVTADFGPTSDDGEYALRLTSTGSPGKSGVDDHHHDGQDGGDGVTPRDLSTTMSFDLGYGIASATGGIYLGATGGDGGAANEDSKTWKHATGGTGGRGGDGATLTLTAQSDGGGKTPAAIITQNGAGLILDTKGGTGGKGGKGTVQSIFHQGQGGLGGAGGAGGTISVQLNDGHLVNATTGNSAGLGLFSIGGTGGQGGEGLSGDEGFGADGGAGGNGGAITFSAVSSDNTIATTGDEYHGIVAISEAGDGGKGGKGHGPSKGEGGNGGQGGAGGDVDVEYSGTVSTDGAQAQGVFIQSIGGAGGDGGEGDSAFEGKGGATVGPGPAGGVSFTLDTGTITTKGGESNAILMQSIGGFAGSSRDADGFVAYGASGQSGGNGADVNATFDSATLKTQGDYSGGLVTLSVGGGGGTGAKDAGFTALGSDGGAGGNGGDLSIALSGTSSITTQGKDASGLIALSIGGGGGVSGANDGVVALGGQGGNGGDAGSVGLVNDGGTTIATGDDHAVGILLGSVGGGGGKSTSPGAAWAFGAQGGDGGQGDDATLALNGGTLKVSTTGENADGVVVSSIGGGGGHGGGTVEAIEIMEPAIGSSGGSGGDGGNVAVTSDGGRIDVATLGAKATGFLAQSIGGGGGAGGYVVNVEIGMTFNQQTGAQNTASGHHGGTISIGDKDTAGLAGTIKTEGDSAAGVLVQSIGGGGGVAGNSIEAGAAIEFNQNMGSNGGAGGDGGTVLANMNADVTTTSVHADGIVAQSVGGGGGHSSNIVNSDVAGLEISQFVGNQGAVGGDGGNGGSVTLRSDGSVKTVGDTASGVLAQSVGGGGGKGGHTVDADASVEVASVKLGATGGAGGDADDVDLTVSGEIETRGHLSAGILAQSISGGGGQAGTTISGDVGISLDYAHGGDGGDGGQAGAVTTMNQASVQTSGDWGIGVLGQSIGHGGGVGGLMFSGKLSMAELSITHGGDGGDGGRAGTVTLTNSGDIATSGKNAVGVLAQSIGGGGGTGGVASSASITVGEMSGAVDVSIGGDGGKGGTSDDVALTNSGALTIRGYQSAGLVAQSIGGNGGAGGAVHAGIVSLDAEGSGTVNVVVGGDGGDSGTAGDVSIINDDGGDIDASGHYSEAIFAQSVGGNGGVGGGSYAFSLSANKASSIESSVTIGGSGGSGAVGGDVSVDNRAKLSTSGGNAHGLRAQSIGGNGGTGAYGFLFAGEYSQKPASGNMQINLDASVGGSGGAGSDAGKVSVVNSGDISTATETSYGIFAQSVGGGGGDGGSSGAHSFGYTKTQQKTDPKYSFALTFNMGGSDGASGDGDDVSVQHSKGTIKTAGKASYAIYAQSVGGGGGTSGNGTADGKGWIADIKEVAEWADDIYDTYEEITGLLKGSVSIGINIGGKSGASGTGGDVTVENDGTLHTIGDSATAIYAQSIGGGGGNGGDAAQGLLTSLTIVQSGSGGGDAGDVAIVNTGAIKTEGDGAMGIYAQSVGGGGGSGGDMEGNLVTGFADFLETAGAEIFGTDDGGAGGSGGDMTISGAGDIATTGKNAHGIWLQTVGGGGGASGVLDTQAADGSYTNAIGSAGADGDGGNIDLTVDGKIDVQGEGSHGIFMQSASGGDSYSGGLKLHVSGNVSAAGDNARAILAQTSETGTDDPKGDETTSKTCDHADTQCRGTSHIYVEAGGLVETTSSASHETIAIAGGRTKFNSDGTIHYSNLVENTGTIQSANADAVVIANDAQGGLRIHNLDGGVIRGSLQLNDANRTEFENRSGATFAGGSTIYLGQLGNYLGASGSTMSAYGTGTIGTSVVSFGGVYSEAGTLHVDAALDSDGAASSDQLQFKGLDASAKVDLTGRVETVWSGATKFASGDTGKLLIARLDDNATLDSVSASATDTATVSYTLETDTDKKNVYVNYTVDYSGGASGRSMGVNAHAYADYFNRVMKTARTDANNAKSESLSALATDLLNVTTIRELETIFGHHAPDEYLVSASDAFSSAIALHQLLNSCPTIDAAAGVGFLHQNDCSWVMGIGERLQQKAGSDSPEYNETSWGLALGAQREVAGDTFVEIAGMIETVDIAGENFESDGTRYAMGIALKHEIGRYTFSATAAGGIYSMSNARDYLVGNNRHTAQGDVNGRFLGTELRASAVFQGNAGYYLKPAAALSYTSVRQDGFSETGTGQLNWNIADVNEDWVAFTPSIEFGRAYVAGNRSQLAFVRAGVTVILDDPTTRLSGSLIGVDAAAGEFNGVLSTNRYQGELQAGLHMDLGNRLMLSLTGQTSVASDRTDFGAQAKLEWRF
ncbi:autotransporter outer membrane beta-barrel domain-containing protein [Rhodobacteraceae bacterium F11138]|nr:autotransporter outer membrane beta-barrel domain-containing protein [Rhodobacteraceae bacterium F11138]